MRADAEGQTALRLRQGAQRAEKLDRAVPGRFVTGMERQEAQREAKVCGVLASFDGGWDDAERVQVCFHPDGWTRNLRRFGWKSAGRRNLPALGTVTCLAA